MTTKLEQAARQALEFIDYFVFNGNNAAKAKSISTALREALAEQAECPHGVDDGACKECYMEQAEQEPVACTRTRKVIYDKLIELGASIVTSCCNVPDKRCGDDEWILQTVQIELLLDAIAAPVRTKDLTDDDIAQAVGSPLDEVYLADFRAVIAADRELNK